MIERTRQRVTRPAICRCRKQDGDGLAPGGRPITYATFRAPRPGADAELVSVVKVHWTNRDRCPMPIEVLDPRTWGK